VLLNLHSAWPPAFSRFQRLVEIVGRDEEDREARADAIVFTATAATRSQMHDLSKSHG